MEYQPAWKWIRSNWHGPVAATAYVTAVSLGIEGKNIVSDRKYEVFVEEQPRHSELMEQTIVCLPRVCIARRGDILFDVVARAAITRISANVVS